LLHDFSYFTITVFCITVKVKKGVFMQSKNAFEYIPEYNLVVLFVLILCTAGIYYFWWIARVSRIFYDNPVTNILLIILTAGIWLVYITIKYMQKSEMLNDRQMPWYMILFLPIGFLIIQHNINERYFTSQ